MTTVPDPLHATLRVNLGSGPSGLPNWVNLDWGVLPWLSKWPRLRRGAVRVGLLPVGYDLPWPPIRLADLRKRLPLPTAGVDFIYCSHVLEHFERWQALAILRECRRVLRPSGVVRVVVPDLARICRGYLAGENGGPGVSPGREACRRVWGHPKEVEPIGWAARLRRGFIRGHEWLYDEAEMRLLMEEGGFMDIRARRFREGECPDLDRLDLESHAPLSLYMEAVR